MPAPKFQRGDVVLAHMPHAQDLSSSYRPTLVVGDPLENTNGDYILLQITSTTYRGRTDYVLDDSDPEFAQTGLSHTSTFRCHKIFVYAEPRVQRRLGSVGPKTLQNIEQRLRIALGL